MMRRALLGVVLSAALATAAACGGAQQSGAAGAAASLAPADARALVEIDGNLDSAQWRAARDLVERFPDGGKVLEQVRRIDPVAGDQVLVVATGDKKLVALTQPDDESKLQSLVSEHHLVSRDVAGWTAVADEAATLDGYQQALDRGTLTGDARYESALKSFPADALARGYARGDRLFDWTALALTAEEDGFRIAGRVHGGVSEPRPVPSALLDEVPNDALAVLAFGGGQLPAELPNLFGVDLRPILGLFAGGGVAWARPGLPIPEVTALLPNGDAAAADELLKELTGSQPEAAQLEGRPAKRVRLGMVTITYGDVDGRLVVTTASAPGGTGRLADDPDFQEARQVAHMPDTTNGFLWVDGRRAAPLLGFLPGVDDALARNFDRVASLLAFSRGDGPDQEIGVFLQVR